MSKDIQASRSQAKWHSLSNEALMSGRKRSKSEEIVFGNSQSLGEKAVGRRSVCVYLA
jgi:hypothetical protein